MPVWLSFVISLVLVGGFLATLFGVVSLLVEGRRTTAAPRLGLVAGEGPGTFNVWVNWEPSQFAVEVYRLRFQYLAPFSLEKEGTFTVTFATAQAAPFMQCVEFPARFKTLLDSGREKGILTVDFRTVDETCIQNTYTFDKVRKILSGGVKKSPAIANKLPKVQADVATVLTLDFEELTVNRKRISDLEAAAKAKAAKMAAKPAAAPVAAPAPVVAAPAPAPVVADSTAAVPPAPQDKAVKSVRDVVSQQNNKPVEK